MIEPRLAEGLAGPALVDVLALVRQQRELVAPGTRGQSGYALVATLPVDAVSVRRARARVQGLQALVHVDAVALRVASVARRTRSQKLAAVRAVRVATEVGAL